MEWYFGYMQKPDGLVCICGPFEETEQAYNKLNSIRAPDMRVTTLITSTNKDDALKQAKQILRQE